MPLRRLFFRTAARAALYVARSMTCRPRRQPSGDDAPAVSSRYTNRVPPQRSQQRGWADNCAAPPPARPVGTTPSVSHRSGAAAAIGSRARHSWAGREHAATAGGPPDTPPSLGTPAIQRAGSRRCRSIPWRRSSRRRRSASRRAAASPPYRRRSSARARASGAGGPAVAAAHPLVARPPSGPLRGRRCRRRAGASPARALATGADKDASACVASWRPPQE